MSDSEIRQKSDCLDHEKIQGSKEKEYTEINEFRDGKVRDRYLFTPFTCLLIRFASYSKRSILRFGFIVN